MPLLTLEHSPGAYRADFVVYGATSLTMAVALALGHPPGTAAALALWAAAGVAAWSPVEYLLHRFVLHGMAPFDGWHAEHHRRPTALIGSPTLFSAGLFTGLAGLPAWALLGTWPALALVFGLVTGYLAYSLTHHAMHHAAPRWRPIAGWVSTRRRWHARHHGALPAGARRGQFGVSSSLWDRVFGTAGP